ncbi:hypothetical protein E2C01_013881 [Portunus trituberculatus]|uniref:Uncharacterized protein n=1 Tax=Portunus trituberculatus TaxID=210409 RepID=A0A5B7DHS2_PORTR|nr:hypothetical protein [Portunus trituberculatus]
MRVLRVRTQKVPESDSPLPKPSQCRPSTPPSPHEGSPLLPSRPVSPEVSERDDNLQAVNDVQNETANTGKHETNVPNDSVETRTDSGAKSASGEDLDRQEAAICDSSEPKEEVFVVIEPSTTDCGSGIKLDDGAYNPLWTTKGFTQTFHFWKESRRAQSVPLNAYLTYVTLPWFTIITDILDHRTGPILTF